VQWDPVPIRERNGKILGYSVEVTLQQQRQGRRKLTTNFTASRFLTLSGLKKYSEYVIRVCALTRRGKGPSRALTVQTDEDGKNKELQKPLVGHFWCVVQQWGIAILPCVGLNGHFV